MLVGNVEGIAHRYGSCYNCCEGIQALLPNRFTGFGTDGIYGRAIVYSYQERI